MKEACGNCHWFRPEPETQINPKPNVPIVAEQKSKQTIGQKIAIEGGSRPPVYGKCKAVFQDKDNKTQVYDFGAFSNASCTAIDDFGYKLFTIG